MKADSVKKIENAYDAFLSYSHEVDTEFARLLQRRVERMGARLPWQRRVRVFRDETSLAARPDLWGAITTAIDRSATLILLASPTSAASVWVQREVEYFLASNDVAQLVIVLIEGDTPWTVPEKRTGESRNALSPAVLQVFAERNWQPLVIDFRLPDGYSPGNAARSPEFLTRVASISAAVQNRDKDEIYGEHIRAQRFAMLSLAAIAILISGLAIIAMVQRDAAVTARDLAERRLDQALEVANHINFVIEEDLRYVGGASNIRTDLLDASGELLDSLLGEAAQNQEALFQRAVGHAKRADLAIEHEYLDAAERELEAAAGLTARLVQENPDNPEWQQALSVVLNQLGQLYVTRGQPQLAFQRFERAYQIRQRLAELEPDDGRRRLDVAVSIILLADMLVEIGRNDDAIEYYRDVQQALALLAEENPGALDLQRNLVTAGDRIGDIHMAAERYAQAADEYRRGESVLREMLQGNPGHTGLRRDLIGSLQRLGDVHLADQVPESALERYREAEAITQGLVDQEPDNLDWLMVLSVVVRKVADAESAAGEPDAARITYERSLAIARDLVALDPDNADLQEALAGAVDELAQFQSNAGDHAAARELFAELIEVRAVLADRGETVDRLSDLGAAYLNAGLALEAEDEIVLATQAYQDAVGAYEDARLLDPDNDGLSFSLANLLNELGNLSYNKADLDAAADYYQRAADVAVGVTNADRAAPKLAWSFYRLGRIQSAAEEAAAAAGSRGEAVKPALKAVTFYARARSLVPDDEDYADVLLWSQNHVYDLVAGMPDATARLTVRALAAEAEQLLPEYPAAAAELHRLGAAASLDILHDPALALRFSTEAVNLSPNPSAGFVCAHAEILLAAQSSYDEIMKYSKRCVEGAELPEDRIAGHVFTLAASVLAGDATAANEAAAAIGQSLGELGAAPLDWSFEGLQHALAQHEHAARTELVRLLEALAVGEPGNRKTSTQAALRAVLTTGGQM